jgi:hypothetical protein
MNLLAWIKIIMPQWIKDIFNMVEFCERCGARQPIGWMCDSDELWKRVNGTVNGTLCPLCFDKLAREQNIVVFWHAIEYKEKK